jgi:MFS family permease
VSSSQQGFGSRFWSLIGATFLGFLGIGTVLPGLAPHVRFQLGGSDQTVGFVIGIFSLTALVSRFISGPLADRRGRKVAMVAGLVSCALAGVAYLLPIGLSSAFLARILQGFGEACLYTGAAAWAVELAGIDRGAQALGYLSSGIWGGISAGPVIGNWVGSFEHAALFQSVAAVVALIVLSRVRETYEGHVHSGPRPWIPTRLIMPGIAIGFVNVHYPVVAGFLILHLAQHGNAGPVAFSAYAGVILTSRFLLGGLPDRIHPAITFFAGLACMAVGLIGIASGPTPFAAVAFTALLGFGFSFPWASIAATVLRRTPATERGSAVSILSAFYDLFVGVSSVTAGTVAKHYGYSAAFYMAAASLLLAAIAGRAVFKSAEHGNAPVPRQEFAPTAAD